jgi:hypothetical protein
MFSCKYSGHHAIDITGDGIGRSNSFLAREHHYFQQCNQSASKKKKKKNLKQLENHRKMVTLPMLKNVRKCEIKGAWKPHSRFKISEKFHELHDSRQ